MWPECTFALQLFLPLPIAGFPQRNSSLFLCLFCVFTAPTFSAFRVAGDAVITAIHRFSPPFTAFHRL